MEEAACQRSRKGQPLHFMSAQQGLLGTGAGASPVQNISKGVGQLPEMSHGKYLEQANLQFALLITGFHPQENNISADLWRLLLGQMGGVEEPSPCA